MTTETTKKKKFERIYSSAGNYYGCAAAWEKNGKYFLGVENYDGFDSGEEISKVLFDAWVKEFGS